MKLGLIRHFKVKRGYPNKILTPAEFMKWVEEYDASEVEENDINNGNVDWKKCYSSDLPRAKTTAQAAYKDEIIYLEDLREIPLAPFFRLNMKLPLFLHLFFIRIAWYFNHKSQPKSKQVVIRRINEILDRILQEDKDVLIVGHGGIMMFMRKELLKRGFTGPKFGTSPENGKVYIFEN